jgi:hypothetical protein
MASAAFLAIAVRLVATGNTDDKTIARVAEQVGNDDDQIWNHVRELEELVRNPAARAAARERVQLADWLAGGHQMKAAATTSRNLRRLARRSGSPPLTAADREADVLFASVKKHLEGLSTPIPPGELYVMAKDKTAHLFDREDAKLALKAYGLGALFNAVETARAERDPLDVPVVLLVGDEACVAWLECNVLAPGGSA